MKPIQHFPKPKTEERQKSRQTPSTAVIPTVAIHRGDHGTYEPARTTIEQKQSASSRLQSSKEHSRKSNLQHGDVMLQHESVVRRDGIQCKGVISCHSHFQSFVGSIPTTWRWADIAQIVMPAHELQLTYGRRVNPIQHFPINQGSTVTSQRNQSQKEEITMSDFNETYADAINSNSEERTSSMSDYSTSTTTRRKPISGKHADRHPRKSWMPAPTWDLARQPGCRSRRKLPR